MWRLFSLTICLLVWYTNYFVLSVTVSEYISSTYNRCLPASPPAAATAPFHYEFFSSLPFTLSVRLSFCNLLCVRYTHTHTHLDRRRRRRLLGRASGRCEEVWDDQCVCEHRYRQVVFIIIVFFPDGFDERHPPYTYIIISNNNTKVLWITPPPSLLHVVALSRRPNVWWWVSEEYLLCEKIKCIHVCCPDTIQCIWDLFIGIRRILLLYYYTLCEMSNSAATAAPREYLRIRLGLISHIALCSNISVVCIYR